jgi:hypothetical protein
MLVAENELYIAGKSGSSKRHASWKHQRAGIEAATELRIQSYTIRRSNANYAPEIINYAPEIKDYIQEIKNYVPDKKDYAPEIKDCAPDLAAYVPNLTPLCNLPGSVCNLYSTIMQVTWRIM